MTDKKFISRRSFIRKTALLNLAPFLGSCAGEVSSTGNTKSLSAPYDGAIKVGTGANSNRFINDAGEAIQLRGGNFSGLETTPAHFWSPGDPWGDDGGTPPWDEYAKWKPNVARLPLNAAAWLKLTCQATTGAEGSPVWEGSDLDLDPLNNYKQFIYDAVASLQAIGCYVIFDLHWCAPQVELGGTTHYLLPAGQSAFADYDTAIPFWTSMANTFGTQATPPTSANGPINNHGIMFELFNEPFMNTNGGTMTTGSGGSGSVLSADQILSQGGYSSTIINNSQGGVNFVLNKEWRVAGYTEMLTAVRNTGAENICIINGNDYTKQMNNYTTYGVTDTLPDSQIAYGWHPYPTYGSTYPSDPAYLYTNSDYPGGNGNANCVVPAENIMAAGFPVICTEDGGHGGSTATSGEPHMAWMQAWADASGASYIFWQWNNTRPYGTTDAENYLTEYAADGTTVLPIQGSGQTTYDWMVNHS